MKEKPIKLLEDLIRIESYSGHEEDIARFITENLESHGIEVRRVGGNLVAFIPGEDQSRAFVFNSHMDTVAADSGWKYGPHNPTMEDGKLIGLGASDMKSGLAASMLLAEYYSQNTPPGDMYFTYVVMEEVDGSGSRDTIAWMEDSGILSKYKEMGAIFTEGTDLAMVEHGHMGNIFLKLAIQGESSHGSRPIEDSNHAVLKMVEFSNQLEEEYLKWRQGYMKTDLFPPSIAKLTSIWANVTSDKEGNIVPSSPNKFPGVCYASIDIRTVPGFHEEIVDLIKSFGEKYGVSVEYVADPAPYGLTKPDDKLVTIALETIDSKELVVSKGSADLGFFTTKGVKSIILGPGVKLQAHRKDEYAYPERVEKSVEVYEKVVSKWFAS